MKIHHPCQFSAEVKEGHASLLLSENNHGNSLLPAPTRPIMVDIFWPSRLRNSIGVHVVDENFGRTKQQNIYNAVED